MHTEIVVVGSIKDGKNFWPCTSENDVQEWLQFWPFWAALFDYVIDWSSPSKQIELTEPLYILIFS